MPRKSIAVLSFLLIFTLLLSGCKKATEKVKIGLSFATFAEERWPRESDQMKSLLEAKGYEVIVQEAAQDAVKQNDQIDNMVTQGVKGIILVAQDGDAAATAVDKAAAAGVKVIAYDRLVYTDKLAAYLTFNNVDVGKNEALGVINALGIPDGSGGWTAENPARIIMSYGSPTDNNAHLVKNGQHEVIKEYVDSGVIEIVAEEWVDGWDPAKAQTMMENVLVSIQNDVDGVIASNDGTALGEIEALRAQGLAGKVPISGQDATATGCNSIVKGELTVSVFKDFSLMAPKAVEVLDNLVKGVAVAELKSYTMAELTNDETKTGSVMGYFLQVVQVTKENVYDVIVKTCFQPYDDVYLGIPDDQRPPKVECPA